jgi:hypothetical protein
VGGACSAVALLALQTVSAAQGKEQAPVAQLGASRNYSFVHIPKTAGAARISRHFCGIRQRLFPFWRLFRGGARHMITTSLYNIIVLPAAYGFAFLRT